MRVKIFECSWSVELHKLESAINDFLASLPAGAVKHVHTAMAATRTSETDQSETDYIVTIWYEGRPKKASRK